MSHAVKYKLNGKVVSRDEFHKDGPIKGMIGANSAMVTVATYSESNPLVSTALGCHREMVDEYNGEVKRRGITGVEFLPDGQCKITSRAGRAAWLKSLGRHDNDGGYGDG